MTRLNIRLGTTETAMNAFLSINRPWRLVGPLCLPLLAAILLAYTAAVSSAERSQAYAWRLELDAGSVKQFKTSVDTGGDFDINRYLLQLSAMRKVGENGSVGLTLSYGESRYRFSGNTGFAGLDPWGTIREARVAVPLRYRYDSTWTFYGIPSLRYRAETGAKLSDSDKWGVLAGASYRFSDRLTIGPGVGIFAKLNSGIDLSPILLIDWKITDTLSLTTGSDLVASRGPGLSLTWLPVPRWAFGLSGRLEKISFQLDKDGPAPNGIGRDKSIPLAISATYEAQKAVRLHLLAGVEFAGNLRLKDSDGDPIADSDYATAPFVGLLITLRP